MSFDPELQFADPADDWRWWFAWRPIRAANYGWVWLRWVEWRPCVVHWYLTPGGGDLFWQYRR